MAHRDLLRTTLLALCLTISLCLPVTAQPDVPRVTYVNPVAGLSIEIPEDWEMATNDWGLLNVGIEAGVGTSLAIEQPQLWFFFSTRTPEQLANELAQAFALGGGAPQVGPTGNGDEWQVSAVSDSVGGPLAQRWLCRRQGSVGYAVGALVRPAVAAQFQQDLDVALASARLVPGPPLQLFLEPSENAYRMLIPQGWRWSGRIIRTPQAPGVFEWRVERPDGLAGALNVAPASFNIQYPYATASQCAGTWVLQGLRAQLPDVRLESVQEFPRASAHFTRSIRQMGLGAIRGCTKRVPTTSAPPTGGPSACAWTLPPSCLTPRRCWEEAATGR